MTKNRFVVLGLAQVRAAWPTEIARWSTSGLLPVEFIHCVSDAELRVRIGEGRPHSLALLDQSLSSVDRDLLGALAGAAVPTVLLVPEGAPQPDGWRLLGATDLMVTPTSPHQVLDVLRVHATPIRQVTGADTIVMDQAPPVRWRGRLIAVTGQPGSGRSTIAGAAAQHLASDPRIAGDVVLADLAHRAHQALLHDAGDVVPGLQELVEAHRGAPMPTSSVRELQFSVPGRGYRILLGLRRPQDWITVRDSSFTAALDTLCTTARIVVADVDADVEGEHETGSMDVEDRNLLARRTLEAADVVVILARPTTAGIHTLAAMVREFRAHGVDGGRVLLVLNDAPRSPKARAELSRAVAAVLDIAGGDDAPRGPVYLPWRRGIETIHRDVARFPDSLARSVGAAISEMLDAVMAPATGPAHTGPGAARPVIPGSLGLTGRSDLGT